MLEDEACKLTVRGVPRFSVADPVTRVDDQRVYYRIGTGRLSQRQ